jgi:hypothetical protein
LIIVIFAIAAMIIAIATLVFAIESGRIAPSPGRESPFLLRIEKHFQADYDKKHRPEHAPKIKINLYYPEVLKQKKRS